MMGHRGKLKTGDEWDAFTNWRKVVFWQRGELKRIKRRYAKRQRRAGRRGLTRRGKCDMMSMRHQRAGLFIWPGRRELNTVFQTKSPAVNRVEATPRSGVATEAASAFRSRVFCI
jgi:hypothetical protein